MKPAVSVIIPYYHGNRFLPGLLEMMRSNAENLRNETGSGLEVLIINDSPDETIEIDEQPYSLKILTNPKNSGIHATRANGLKTAEGEYILFLDQDDRITNNCLVSQLRHIGKHDFVVGNGYDDEPGGGQHLIFSGRKQQLCSTDLKCHYYYNNLIRSPGQVLIRKASIPAYWSEQILNNNGSDDAFLWILMLCEGAKGTINEDVVFEHVFTGQNTSGDNSGMLNSQREVAEKLNGIASPLGMRAFLRRAEYYCQPGKFQKYRYWDVGLRRKVYSARHMSERN